MRQQQQPEEEPISAWLSGASHEQTPDHTQGIQPGTFKPGDLHEGVSVDAIATLSHLLVVQPETTEAIARTVELGLNFLPDIVSLRLVELAEAGPGALVKHASSYAIANHGALTRNTHPPRYSLGFGEAVDRQVLVERRSTYVGNTLCYPLLGRGERLVGVLVVEQSEPGKVDAHRARLNILADHLILLLDRLYRERAARREAHVLTALAALANPVAPTREDTGEQGNQQTQEEEARVLRNAAALLEEAASPLACDVYMPSDGGILAPLDSSRDGIRPLASVEAESLRSALSGSRSLTATASNHDKLWNALAERRSGVASHAGIEPAACVLVPVSSEGKLLAILAVLLAAPPDEASWLPVASALAGAAAAGIRTLRLTADVAAEGMARDAFISLAAHELRSPLTSIKGYAQLLTRQARKTPLPESMLHSVEAIEQQSVRMAEMVGELLDASRILRGVVELQAGQADLVPLAQKVLERRRIFYPQHEFTLESETPSLEGAWDPQRVEQVLRDLLDNAARFSPAGGVITVRLTRANNEAVVSVRDEGIGIMDEDRERIFEYLYRAPAAERRNLAGLGLGLFVARSLVEHLGGRLWLKETSTIEPTGSEFQFSLPLA